MPAAVDQNPTTGTRASDLVTRGDAASGPWLASTNGRWLASATELMGIAASVSVCEAGAADRLGGVAIGVGVGPEHEATMAAPRMALSRRWVSLVTDIGRA
jgi:hypothetical protein